MNKKLTQILAILCMFVLLASSAFAADITLTSPLGGDDDGVSREYYDLSADIPITWDYDTAVCGADTDAVTIEYSDDAGLTWFSITASATVNDDSYNWDALSFGVADGNEYQVRLVSSCNTPDDVSASFTIDQTAPVADIADVTIDEGDDVTLDASLSSDATSPLVSYTYTINGVAYTGGAQTTDTLDLTWAELDADYGVSNDGTYTIEVEVEDAAGNTHTDTATLTVENVAATVTVVSPNGGEELTATETIEFTIEDPVDTSFDYDVYYEDNFGTSGLVLIESGSVTSTGTVTVSWDTTSTGVGPSDSDDVTVYVEVDDGTDTSDDESDTSFLVDNTNPTAAAGTDQTVDEGDLVTFSFTADDGTSPSGSEFDNTGSYYIDFDDGTNLTTDDLSLITHTYTDNGAYTVSLTVTDDVGLSHTDDVLITVNNVAPVVVAGSDVSAYEGEELTITATFTDVGADDTHIATIDWGDGETDIITTATSPIEITHTYADEGTGTYPVTITVEDDDAGSAFDTLVATISNVAPTVEITAPVDGEYLADSVDIEWDSMDVGIEDNVDMEVYYAEATAATVCGDSADWTSFDSFTESFPVNGSFDASWDTTAVADGEYDLCVLVTDDDLDSSEDFVRSVVVDNTAPDAYGPEVSSDHFRSDNYVYFTVSAYDAETGIASAVVEIYDEDGALVATESMDASDGVFEDDLFEGLQAWVMIDSATFADGVYTYMFWVEDLSGNRNADESASDLVIGTFIVDATADDPRYTNDQINDLIDALNTTIQTLEGEVANLTTNISALESVSEMNSNDIESLNLTLVDVENETTNLWNFVFDLESNDTNLQKQIINLQTDLTSINGTVSNLTTNVSSLNDEFTAYTGFTISQTSDTSDADGSYSVTVTTSSSAVCTITNAVDSSETTTTSAGTTHSLSVTDADLGMQIYTVTCTESTYGWTKESTAYVNVVGFYNLFIADGGNDGFLARVQSFIVSYAELVAAGLTSFDVDSVLTSTDGPSDMALDTSSDVDMLWAYNGTTWSSYNVTNSSGDFAGFNATDVPVYYWMTLEDSAAGKAIIH